MQISLRSQLIAGTAAVVGASAIAMTPVTAAHLNLPTVQVPSLAQVTLAGFDSPLSELLGTLVLSTNYLFNTDANPALASSWAFSNFGTEFGTPPANIPNIVPGALTGAGIYSSVGLIPQIIDDALPIISQLGYNGSDYLQATTTGLYAAGYSLSEGVWNAAGDLLSFDIPGAVETLWNSINEAGTYLLLAGGYVASGVFNRAVAVLETVIDLVPTLIGATLGQIQVLGDAVAKVVTDFVGAFSSADPIENAWNAVVDGLLGPSGIPGTVINLTLGAGVQTGPIAGLGDIEANFVPSIRTEVQGGVRAIADALATPVQGAAATAAVAAPAAAVAEVEAPAAVTEVKEPAADVTEVKEAPAAEAPVAAEVGDAPAAEAPAAEAPTAPSAPAATAGDSDGGAKANTPKRAPRAGKRG